jgi:hypothetical protein
LQDTDLLYDVDHSFHEMDLDQGHRVAFDSRGDEPFPFRVEDASSVVEISLLHML